MTNTISVPRELLLELRDSANDCYNNEVRRYKDDRRRIIYKALVDKADAILAQPAHDVASVPDATSMARALCNYHADLCGVNREDQWFLYSDDFKKDVAVMLAAAPSPVHPTETNDQIAKVMLLHGTPEQQVEAARYAGIQPPVQASPDIEQIMAKATELFGWAAGLGGFDDAVRELVRFIDHNTKDDGTWPIRAICAAPSAPVAQCDVCGKKVLECDKSGCFGMPAAPEVK